MVPWSRKAKGLSRPVVKAEKTAERRPAAAVEGVLPPGWSKEYDGKEDEWYYWHKLTKTAQWERPKLVSGAASPLTKRERQDEQETQATAADDREVIDGLRVHGIVTSWKGLNGWISPLDRLAEDLQPLLDAKQGHVYVSWRSVEAGLKLATGVQVDFSIGADGGGLVAEDVRLHSDVGRRATSTIAVEKMEKMWATQERSMGMERPEQDSLGVSEAVLSSSSGTLLPGWEEMWCDAENCPYYWHAASGQSTWERPSVFTCDDDDEDANSEAADDEQAGEGKVWQGEAAEQGASRLATPLTPLMGGASKSLTPATPAAPPRAQPQQVPQTPFQRGSSGGPRQRGTVVKSEAPTIKAYKPWLDHGRNRPSKAPRYS
eukprot:TRINITY_DN13207_c0_g1_i1.p1 TRINITY_DN13207_c0_g1~~TRINITY_DN13207_c0_g1_i1.p1  ORF type:complete len:375 (+),score=89.71 TRINITY_DN13207_c0_g1_i1:61-1185(+)